MAFSPPTSYAKDEEGGTFIAASQRPDGSWRKPRRVRDGYVPQEEVPLYESKGRQFTKQAPQYPVGLDPALIRAAEARKDKAARTTSSTKISPIPGLVLDVAKSKKKKKKAEKVAESVVDEERITDGLSRARLDEWEPVQRGGGKSNRKDASGGNKKAKQPAGGVSNVDPAKRLKNLRKRLREIEAIEERIASGELKTLEKDQVDKVARKREVLDEIEEMESLVCSDPVTPV